MTFLEVIFERLQRATAAPVVCEIHDGAIRGVKKGDRCALLAPNSIRWIALDLALLAEGAVVVPLYSRQALPELVHLLTDVGPSRIFCSSAAVAAEIKKLWPQAPHISLIESAFIEEAGDPTPPVHHEDADVITIIYTSGTSGEAKGVMLNAANVTFMLGCTNERLDRLMGPHGEPDRVFHYLPFSFAASWIAMLSFITRDSTLTLSTDLTKLADELKLAAPNYFLNVPTLLERVRATIQETIGKRSAFASNVFSKAQYAFARQKSNEKRFADPLWLALANFAMFPTIRAGIGPNLKGLICGSAPLSIETQLFFMMLGIPVLQVYGLTETTAICTMDEPGRVRPGRVGFAIPGTEMQVVDTGEILVRGPHIFPGYWKRPEETAKVLEGGWFHTGDQGEVDANGYWRLTGRLKNLIVLNSGHKVPPEPLEAELAQSLPGAQKVILVGNQRSFLSALVVMNSGNGFSEAMVQSAIDFVNAEQPHYKQVRAFKLISESLTPENGLLTSMGKLKRDAITTHFAAEIEEMYQKKSS